MGGNHPKKAVRKAARKTGAAAGTEAAYEDVARPAHYAVVGNYDVIDIIRARDLGFEKGNALKYLIRAGTKPGVDEAKDIEKAIYYLRRHLGQVK